MHISVLSSSQGNLNLSSTVKLVQPGELILLNSIFCRVCCSIQTVVLVESSALNIPMYLKLMRILYNPLCTICFAHEWIFGVNIKCLDSSFQELWQEFTFPLFLFLLSFWNGIIYIWSMKTSYERKFHPFPCSMECEWKLFSLCHVHRFQNIC